MTLPSFEWLAVDGLACYRLTRLITADVILDRPRSWLYRNYVEHASVQYLLGCAWCVSIWVALPVLALTAYAAWFWVWLAWPLAISAVAGYLSERA